MGPDLKLTEKSEAIVKVVSTNMKKRNLAQCQEEKGVQGNVDTEIDITERMNYSELEMIDVECQDATEYSSSFEDTESGDENGLVVNDDLEVESPLYDTRLFRSLFDGCDGPLQMGKRRLTDHWRRFIHPLMWRCKWLEVKLHDFKSQALKYDRELAKYGQSEQFDVGKVTFQGFDEELRAFPSKIQKKEVMKRKKRKRVEDTADVASYMSDHNIFSYYESRKSVVAASALDNDWGEDNKTINGYDDVGGWPVFKSRDGDNWSEQILRNIEVLRSRIQKLKTRMDKLMTESPQKFLPINMLSSVVPCDVLINSGNHLYPEKGDGNSSQCTPSQHESECDMRDNFMPGSAVSSHGVVAPLPDMIRSMSRRLLEISSETIEGDILIPNQAAKEELCNFGSAISQQAEKPKTFSLVRAPGDTFSSQSNLIREGPDGNKT